MTLISGFLLISCLETTQTPKSSERSHAMSQGHTQVFTPIVITLGGYWSCGQNKDRLAEWSPLEYKTAAGPMLGLATKYADAVKKATGQNVGTWLSCYSIDPRQINYVSNLAQPNLLQTTSVSSMISQINKAIEKYPNPRVAVIGHSYGGWTAMEVAANLSPKATLATLITIDPISRSLCTPDVMSNSAVTKNFDTDCQRAPQDFSPKVLASVAKRAKGQWYNFYQLSAQYLHSSAIDVPSVVNRDMAYNADPEHLDGHLRFLIDEELNHEITEIITKNIVP
jgi:pimeloyl-ACP methyl ester carboxylesterase